MNSVTAHILRLPPSIAFEGIAFELQIVPDGEFLSIVYNGLYALSDSPHFEDWDSWGCFGNRLLDGHRCGFLYLDGGIDSDEELIQRLVQCYDFLQKHNLLNT